jgi:cytochrome c peroxidase
LRYVLNRTPVWNKAFIASTAEHIVEGEEPPTGGFGWDGRFNTLHDQAAFPLLAPNEMANAGPEDIVAKLQRAGYAEDFCTVFGAQIFDDPQKAYAAMLVALERFELEDPSFHPYNSKYDDHLDGKVQLSPKEHRGLALFDDPRRGNCSSCHLDRKGIDGSHPLFTDYRSRRWVCRATRKFTPMPRPPTSIGAFAGLCVRSVRRAEVLWSVQNTDAAQCGGTAGVFSQRAISYAEGSIALLCAARYRSEDVVSRIPCRDGD